MLLVSSRTHWLYLVLWPDLTDLNGINANYEYVLCMCNAHHHLRVVKHDISERYTGYMNPQILEIICSTKDNFKPNVHTLES